MKKINVIRVILVRSNGKWIAVYRRHNSKRDRYILLDTISTVCTLIADDHLQSKQEDKTAVVYHLKPNLWFPFSIQ